MLKKTAFLLSLVLPLAALAQQPVPKGDEFRANTYTPGPQVTPSVAADSNGNHVIVWESHGQDGSFSGIHGQRFANDGSPVGGEFQVNTYTTHNQLYPSAAMDADGDFVVVWDSTGQDGSWEGIFARLFSSDGAPQGPDFQVNSYTTYSQTRPSVAREADGDFVVVWDTKYRVIFGKRFANDGSPIGSEFQVNANTGYLNQRSSVALADTGEFIVVWDSLGQDGSSYGVFARRFGNDGSPLGEEFQVNFFTENAQKEPKIATGPDGELMFVWSSYNGSAWDVHARRFAGDGTPQGGDFQVNSYTTFDQFRPAIASDGNGNFVVAWNDRRTYGSYPFSYTDTEISGRVITADGMTAGDFLVNSYRLWADQTSPAVAASGSDFFVVWNSWQDGTTWENTSNSIYGQRYLAGVEDGLSADFGPQGLWHYDEGSWTKPTAWDAEDLEALPFELAADFGVGQGLWVYDYTGWDKLSDWSPYLLTAYRPSAYYQNEYLAAAFDGGRGLWLYDDPGWTKLSGWEPVQVIDWDGWLIGDFGPSRGLWIYKYSWRKITSWSPTLMVAWGDLLAADFDSGRGLWTYDEGQEWDPNDGVWSKFSSWQPEHMVVSNDKLVAAFGSGRGIWAHDTSTWAKISSWDPYALVSWGDKVVAAFDSGRGLWLYESGGWTQLTNWEPVRIEVMAGKLAADFGPGRGIHIYDTAWLKITAWDSEQMKAANLY